MSQHEQQEVPIAYPPPLEEHPNYGVPPVGYPIIDANTHNPITATGATKTRGEGFWAGCAAALCCCCVLDACF